MDTRQREDQSAVKDSINLAVSRQAPGLDSERRSMARRSRVGAPGERHHLISLFQDRDVVCDAPWKAAPPPLEYFNYQVPFDGRYTATSARPSPSKSDGMGRSSPTPHWMVVVCPVPEFRMYHLPSDGRKTATSTFPSPS